MKRGKYSASQLTWVCHMRGWFISVNSTLPHSDLFDNSSGRRQVDHHWSVSVSQV